MSQEPQPESPRDAAIPELVQQHGGCLYRLGVRICGSHQEAEDLVQDTFLLAYENWPKFRGDSTAKTWLYTIASRVCQRTKRLRAGQPERLDSFEELVEEHGPLPVAASDPLADCEVAETKEILSRAIGELPVDFRMPLVLKDIAELSVKEVARVLDLKEATVKTRVHRARLHLRRILAESRPGRESARGEGLCVDLVRAKLEAMDKGIDFVIPEEQLDERCAALCASLDRTREACRSIGEGAPPESLTERWSQHAH